MSRRRLAAIAAIVLAAATVVLAIVVAIEDFPQGVWVVLCLFVAAAAAWFGLVRRGPARLASLVVAALALAGGIVLIATHGRLIEDLAVLAGAVLSLAAARAAFVVHARCRTRARPSEPSSSTTPSRAVARPSGSTSRTRRGPATSSRSSLPAATISSRWSATRWLAAPTVWRWPVGTALRR